jgi:uncharacterized OB-fold protein
MCPVCASLAWDYIVSSGVGTVYSFVVYRHQPVNGLPVPYTVLVVEVDEGIRLVGNLLCDGTDEVDIGRRVEAVFASDVGDDMVLPHWRLVPGS